MKIICLLRMERLKKSFDSKYPYEVWIEPSYAGGNIVKATLLISDKDINSDVPVFDNYKKAWKFAFEKCFGEKAYEKEYGE